MTETSPRQTNVDVLKLGERTIYLVGTAHVSKASADLAEATILEVRPDTVAVELCEGRLQSLKDPDRWKNTDIIAVIRQGRAYVLMAQLVLAAFQKKLGVHLQVKPGEEMMRALTAAHEVHAEAVMADREIKVTLKRTWAALSLWQMCKVSFAMLTGLLCNEKLEEVDIERLKSADALEDLMKEFAVALPSVQRALIEERDQYLAAKIRGAPGQVIVAVVGAGHVAGIKRWIEREIDVAALETIPPKKMGGKIVGWLIPVLLAALVVHAVYVYGVTAGMQIIGTFALVTAVMGALGAALCFAHPLTVLSAFVASPFTTASPFIAAGWVAGLVEALIRKPRVSDLETIADDITTLKGLWANRVSKILLVMCLTNLTAALGVMLAIYLIVK